MLRGTRPWQEELEIIDRTMRTISSLTDPEDVVSAYWSGIGDLIPVGDYVAMSRRNVEAPFYLITRSSRFEEELNPWTQRDRLPKLTGGLLGEIIYANKPVVIDDLPARLAPDDPGHFYLQGFQSLIALPQYDSGEGLNATCMLFPPGRSIDHSLIPTLHWHGSLFGRGTQNLVLRNQLASALAALDRELQVVGEIQRSLLPSELPKISGFDIAADYVTSARAGGDYYDFFPLDGNSWGIFIADVSGHGTPAAVMMAITHAIAHAQPDHHKPPAAMLAYLNDQLVRSYASAGTFVTAFYGVFDPLRRTLMYSSAGHNQPRVRRDGQIIALDDARSVPLGVVPEPRFTEATVQLNRGDLLLLYTDGITEAMPPVVRGQGPRLFGTERLDRVLCESTAQSAAGIINDIRAAVADFTNSAPPTDDRTLISLRCSG
ncbi:MAG TPA: PP2C family protein-serine/threonine phosphatase [Phycisphaerales bacterium]|nr:PP2C family protein-serine/threonine phosphatase [Phycisphaerales bacterium]